MRKELLIATATLGLIAGGAAAQAQGTQEPGFNAGVKGSTSSTQKSSAQKHETTGQASGQAGAKSSQGAKSSEQGTTGQGTQARPLGGFNDRSGNAKDDEETADKDKHSEATDPNRSSAKDTSQPQKSDSTAQSDTTGKTFNSSEQAKPKGDRDRAAGENGQRNQTTGQGVSPAGRGGASVSISTQQRTQLRGVFVREHPARVSHVDFRISVGVAVPRTVHLVPVPRPVIEIVPEYDGYLYFMIGNQIVIVDPDDHEIVAVIDV